MRLFSFFVVFTFFITAKAYSRTPFENLNSILRAHNFYSYFQQTPALKQKVRIAIFDHGFDGIEDALGDTLPESVQYIPGEFSKPLAKESHGRHMAELVYQLATNQERNIEFSPEIYLYNVNGYGNFKAAIESVVYKKPVDIILYSVVRQFGGNYDGKGYINKLVSLATDAGILWVNAAGNFGTSTYNSKVQTIANDWIALPNSNDALEIRCQKKLDIQEDQTKKENKAHRCRLRLALSWNDYKDNTEEGTKKDLDLYLLDDTLRFLAGGRSERQQVEMIPENTNPALSLYPREFIDISIKPGIYFAKIKNRSPSQFGDSDQFRLTAQGDYIEMPNHSKDEENLLIPADHPQVITVGALDDSDRLKSSTSKKLGKPELYAHSHIQIDTAKNYLGSSNAAAVVAAALVVLKSVDPNITRESFLNYNHELLDQRESNNPLSMHELGFNYLDGDDCFYRVPFQRLFDPTEAAEEAHKQGGILVATSHGYKFFFHEDPFLKFYYNGERRHLGDMLMATRIGMRIMSRARGSQLHSERYIELLQIPYDAKICSYPNSNSFFGGRKMQLPNFSKL